MTLPTRTQQVGLLIVLAALILLATMRLLSAAR
jgi:hypothetical protein